MYIYICNKKPYTYTRQIAHPMPIGRAWESKTFGTRSNFRARIFCLVYNEKSLDLSIFN